jgi:hypothetical protein
MCVFPCLPLISPSLLRWRLSRLVLLMQLSIVPRLTASTRQSRSAGGVGHKPLRPETEAILRSLDHGALRADFDLANGAGWFHVNDDTELHIDGIVVRARRMPAPLRAPVHWPRNRSARRTSGQRRWRPTPYGTSHVAARSKRARRNVALHFCPQRQVL